MIVSRRWFRSSCAVSSAFLAAALLAFSNGSVFAQQSPQQSGHPLNPPALPANSPSSQPVPPGTTPEEANPGLAPSAPISTSAWTAIGPAPLGSGSGADSGRMTGVAVDPTNSSIIYVAAAGGGVWKTTNGGTSWTPLTDTQTTLAMGSIAIAPTDHLKIYAGTGEANNSVDSNHGRGILVSNDGGSTWTLETAGGAFDGTAIGQIAVDPANENIAYAAVGGYPENGNAFSNTGIWKTTDGGSTWTNVTAAASLTSEFSWSAVVADPNNSSIIYAAVGDIWYGAYGPNAIYRSTDGGTTWAQLTNAPSGSSTGRIALAVSPAAKTTGQHVLYVAISSTVNGGSGGLYYFGRSDNADATTPTFTNLTSQTPNFMGSQGWYDIGLNVDASGVVYCAGVSYSSNILRSTNLGVNWSDITVVGGVQPHTDHHAIVFDSSNRMLIGNDGGLWRYDATVPSWTDLNGNLNTIQFQGIGLHPTSASTVVGGSQDNGTELYTNNTVWAETDGGDGGFAQFSQTNGTRCYSVHPVGSFGSSAFFQRSDSSCASGSWIDETSGFVNANADFYPPFVVDRTNGDHLLIGLDRVYESTDAAAVWSAISTPGSNGFNNDVSGTIYNVDTVALAPANGSNPQVIYAATGGNASGGSLIFVSTNDGAAWTERNLPTCTASGHYSSGCRVNQIVTDANDPTGSTAIAVTNNFTGGGRHVYRTTNAGASWTDISSGLPDLPTWSAQIDTDPNRTIYVSTDSAVYSSVSPYSTWTVYGAGLPVVQGFDLELNPALHLLGVGTHGRGAWEIATPAHVTNVTTTDGNGTYTPGNTIPIVVSFSTTVNVTGTPQLSLDTTPGATATYSSGSGTTALTFLYTVVKGQTTSGNGTRGVLDYTSSAALNLNGGTIIDTSSMPAVLTLYAPGAAGSLSANSSLVVSSPVLITPTVTVTPGSYSITTAQALSVTVAVSGGSGNPTPTGSVTLSGGSYSSASTPLSGGSASINIPAGTLSAGSYTFQAAYTPDSNSSSTYSSANGTAGSPVTVTAASGGGLQFVSVPPCRIVDTRNATGPFGGPEMSAGSTREFDIPQSTCNIPSTAVAYSLNVTVVPDATLAYLTLWPAGEAQPLVSTLNSDGRVKANAAIVPAGTNGGVDVYVTDSTQLVLDIDGYFVPAGTSSALAFYPVTPCRVADTRNATGPLGGPTLSGGTSRDFPVQSSNCGIPSTAQAYSLNVTAVPQDSTLGYLTLWPTGESQPLVSTLNSPTGEVVANAAVVPAGTSGDVSIFVTHTSDVVIDIDGYFAPPGTGGLSLYTVSPCRVIDTRNGAGAFSGTLTVNVEGSTCAPPSTAQGYVFNATVVPSGYLGYLTLWPNGETQPAVSTLNAYDGTITSNMAIVPTTNGSINAYSTDPTQLVLDLMSYFAP